MQPAATVSKARRLLFSCSSSEDEQLAQSVPYFVTRLMALPRPSQAPLLGHT